MFYSYNALVTPRESFIPGVRKRVLSDAVGEGDHEIKTKHAAMGA